MNKKDNFCHFTADISITKVFFNLSQDCLSVRTTMESPLCLKCPDCTQIQTILHLDCCNPTSSNPTPGTSKSKLTRILSSCSTTHNIIDPTQMTCCGVILAQLSSSQALQVLSSRKGNWFFIDIKGIIDSAHQFPNDSRLFLCGKQSHPHRFSPSVLPAVLLSLRPAEHNGETVENKWFECPIIP